VKKLGSVRLGRGIDIRGIAKVLRKYDGIISRSFSLICRGYLRLFFVLSSFSGCPLGSGAASILLPAANRNYFLLSLFSGSRAGGWLRFLTRAPPFLLQTHSVRVAGEGTKKGIQFLEVTMLVHSLRLCSISCCKLKNDTNHVNFDIINANLYMLHGNVLGSELQIPNASLKKNLELTEFLIVLQFCTYAYPSPIFNTLLFQRKNKILVIQTSQNTLSSHLQSYVN
jgi:hypothetical protein